MSYIKLGDLVTYSAMEDLAKKLLSMRDNDGTIDQWGIARIHGKDWMLTKMVENMYTGKMVS